MTFKNLINLKGVIKFNALKIHKGGIVRIPDYIVNECISKKKKLIITHNHSELTSLETDNIIHSIISIENKEFNGKYNGKDITYKLVLLDVRGKDKKQE